MAWYIKISLFIIKIPAILAAINHTIRLLLYYC